MFSPVATSESVMAVKTAIHVPANSTNNLDTGFRRYDDLGASILALTGSLALFYVGSRNRKDKFLGARVLQSVADQFVYIQLCFISFDLVEPCLGRWVPRDEQLAAVLVRDRRSFKRSDAARLIDDLLFVHAD